MQPAADALVDTLRAVSLQPALTPLIGNIQGTPLTDVEALRVELAEQVATSVQWVRSIEYLAQAGVNVFIEIGPGQALSGMVKRIVKGATLLSIGSVADIQKAVGLLREKGVI
jgi:[acyl-carrier-protein] S-malonyltransferase